MTTKQIYPEVTSRLHVDTLREEMKRRNLDALIAVSPENVIYTSGAVIWSQRSIPQRIAMTIISRTGPTAMVLCSIEEGIAREQTWIQDIENYVEGETHPFSVLHDVLDRFGVSAGRIGIESEYFTMALGEQLSRELSAYDLIAADDVFNHVRFIKQPHEIERLTYAARATQQAVIQALDQFKVGMSELALYRLLCAELLGSGSDQVVSLTCCSGKRTTILHAHPTSAPITSGTLIKIDIHGTYGGYRSDVARVAYAGEPTSEQADSLLRFWKLHRSILNVPRIGMTIDTLMEHIEAEYAVHGFEYGVPHMGHSFGLGLHEEPLLTRGDQTILQHGTVLSIEPRALNGPNERYHLEDPVVIDNSGSRVLTVEEDPHRYISIG